MKKYSLILFLSVLLTVVLTTVLTSCDSSTEDTGKLGVAVSILPQAEFIERIGGDRVAVTVMVPPGADPHSYEVEMSQMTALSRAVMYAKVGSGIDFELAWMDKLIAQNEDMIVVDCSSGISLQGMVTEHEQEGEDHDHGTLDPHIWMSPKNAEVMVRNITDGLIQVDPDNRTHYEENRDAYLAELEQLDTDIRNDLSGIGNRVFMVYHPAFGYFAHDYDLTMLPIEAEGKEPTAGGLQTLVEQARENNITSIFAEPQFNPQSAEVIADEIGATVILVDPLARDYIENMRAMAEKLIEALQ